MVTTSWKYSSNFMDVKICIICIFFHLFIHYFHIKRHYVMTDDVLFVFLFHRFVVLISFCLTVDLWHGTEWFGHPKIIRYSWNFIFEFKLYLFTSLNHRSEFDGVKSLTQTAKNKMLMTPLEFWYKLSACRPSYEECCSWWCRK